MRIGLGWVPALLVLYVSFFPARCPAQQSADEEAVWKLEHAYWEDVKTLDLAAYKELWHPNFVGWPFISPLPATKEHITDWITANTAKGLHLESYSLEPAASRVTENLVVVHYWITATWADKNHAGKPSTLRVTHTWIKVGNRWQIISGMSAPEPERNKQN